MPALTLERWPGLRGPEPAVQECPGVSGAARSVRYEIRVEGVLDQCWTAWFEGLEIDSDESQTVISAPYRTRLHCTGC